MEKQILFDSVISLDNLQLAWRMVFEKNASSGIDEVAVKDYSRSSARRLAHLHTLLKEGKWVPSPYYNIEVPKAGGDVRTLSISVTEDKIVQTAVKRVIEPILEHSFSSCSYAYRPGRGHLKCVRRTLAEMRNRDNTCFIHSDVDNYFDSIDRALLLKRLNAPISDAKVLNLIDLCISMGGVTPSLSWNQPAKGIPQGATLSPLLANYYLSPFDQSVTSHIQSYVRYSDDFIIWCRDRVEAAEFADRVEEFLLSRLGLQLNSHPEVIGNEVGVEFLGLFISPSGITLTENKERELSEMISSVKLSGGELDPKYVKNIEGIRRYYLEALPAAYQETFTEVLDRAVAFWEKSNYGLSKKNVEDIYHRLIGKTHSTVVPLSQMPGRGDVDKAIKKRKAEYKRLEAENSELVLMSPGYYLGAGEYGLILRKNGQLVKIRSAAVKHITILSQGVTFSSNLVDYCSRNGIGLTFMGKHNTLSASLLSPKYMATSLWNAQAMMDERRRQQMAKCIILAKMRNQESLCKYFSKYKRRLCGDAFARRITAMEEIKDSVKQLSGISDSGDNAFCASLMAYEANVAVLYWENVRELLAETGVEFYSRVKQGAKDVVNSMLNYGYALLYPRIWQCLLKRKLNPQIGFIHYAEGNANLVFDFIELFRSQVVDRVVISMLRRKEHCRVNDDGLLEDETKKKLTAHIMERLNRHEMYRGQSRSFLDIIDLQAMELSESIADGKPFKTYSAKW